MKLWRDLHRDVPGGRDLGEPGVHPIVDDVEDYVRPVVILDFEDDCVRRLETSAPGPDLAVMALLDARRRTGKRPR